jgi:hypothetical protein
MAIVEAARTTAVTGGVDTHLELNVAAALDSIGATARSRSSARAARW